MSHPTCSSSGRWVYDPSSWIWAGLWLGRRDPMWLTRLGHKRWHSFPLVLSLWGRALWEPPGASNKSGSLDTSMPERPHGEVSQSEARSRSPGVPDQAPHKRANLKMMPAPSPWAFPPEAEWNEERPHSYQILSSHTKKPWELQMIVVV